MENPEKKRERMRKWRAANRERINAQRKIYYATHGRPSRRKDKAVRCDFCEVFLLSKFGSKRGRKYCDDCRVSRNVKRQLNAMYVRRYYQGLGVV